MIKDISYDAMFFCFVRKQVEKNVGMLRSLNDNQNLKICIFFLFRKQVEKNLGMLRSYSVEENSGNRSRQLLREVRLYT